MVDDYVNRLGVGWVVQGKGGPFPYEGAYLVGDLVGLTPASTFPELGEVEKGKGIPCYAGIGAFSIKRYKFD